jgi:hypothetical protein
MRCTHRPALRAASSRRLLCAGLLLAYALTAAGVPLPSGQRSEKSGEPFPCAASSCGCRTADECWRSCCCHSLAERLVWARRHGVKPPEFAIAAAKAQGLDVYWLAEGRRCIAFAPRRSACCAKSPAPRSCCHESPVVEENPAAHSCCEHDRAGTSVKPGPASAHHVVVWQALKCRGQSMNWLVAAPALVNLQPEISHELPLVAWLEPMLSDLAERRTDDPAVPPPESMSAAA